MSERDYSVSQIQELIPYGSFDEIYELCESGEVNPYMTTVKNKIKESNDDIAEETEGTVAEERELFDKLINVLNCYECDVEKVVFYLKNGGKMTGLLIGQSWRMI